MSMKFNGTELSDVYFNGTQLDKVYFNGVLVFEKINGYKRRLMVGDELPEFTYLYFDFPEGYHSQITADKTVLTINTKIQSASSYTKTVHICDRINSPYKFVGFAQNEGSLLGDVNGPYSYDSSTQEEYNISSDFIYEDWKINSIVDCPTYRHIYIEDPNIRPLQVGDFINQETQFYGIFPDNYGSNDEYGSVCELDGGSENGYWDIWGQAGESSGKIVLTMVNFGGSSPVYQQGSTYASDEDINLSFWKMKDIDKNWFGEVTSIDNSLNAYSYILVDETTLGRQFLRVPQVGDCINDETYFYYHYTIEDVENTVQLIQQNQFTDQIFLTLSNGWTLGEYYNASTSELTVEWRASGGTTKQNILKQKVTLAVPGMKTSGCIANIPINCDIVQVHNQEYLRKHIWLDSRTTSEI